ncbi:hypothetical protein DMA11_15670 [Marinilabiliaceae bacterium JC017]|nr:hypothetical protein DMA11_15670 [Marinilabiliaceae bacterium JC017]
MDESEIKIAAYREYECWTERIFGSDSKEYKHILPDSTILPDSIYLNSRYQDYPLVGITYEQAINFCKWRSDRVYEKMLINSKNIELNKDQNTTNYFSIENVKSGKYKITKSTKLKDTPVPVYCLPTVNEWVFAAYAGMNKTLYPFGIKPRKILNKTEREKVSVSENEISKPNKCGLKNMIGNVSEMTIEKGKCKGGNYLLMVSDCKPETNHKYTKPEPWLGFRCICEFQDN